MTPDERHMIEDLFARLAHQAPGDKDVDADRLIVDRLRRHPDAAYMLVQTALVYEHQLQEAALRIAELEDQLASVARPAAASSGGTFLGGRLGGQRGSVPSAGAPVQDRGSPWGSADGGYGGRAAEGGGMIGRNAGPLPSYEPEPVAPRSSPNFGRGAPVGGGQPMPPYQPQAGMPAQQPPARGGGFLSGALATAAGVAGGMMLANSLGSLFGGDTAQAADSTAEANSAQDAAQDAEFDAGGDAGGFDSFDV